VPLTGDQVKALASDTYTLDEHQKRFLQSEQVPEIAPLAVTEEQGRALASGSDVLDEEQSRRLN
jgi:hypothetical protein